MRRPSGLPARRLLVALAVGAMALAGCGGDDAPEFRPARDLVEEAAARNPPVPIALPEDLPEGYRLVAYEGGDAIRGAPVTSRWTYRATSTGASDTPLPDIEICVQEESRMELPAWICGRGAALAVHKFGGGDKATIRAKGPGDASAWTDVEMTRDWETVVWLRR